MDTLSLYEAPNYDLDNQLTSIRPSCNISKHLRLKLTSNSTKIEWKYSFHGPAYNYIYPVRHRFRLTLFSTRKDQAFLPPEDSKKLVHIYMDPNITMSRSNQWKGSIQLSQKIYDFIRFDWPKIRLANIFERINDFESKFLPKFNTNFYLNPI